jgi:microcystin-dependent protein
MTITIPAPRNTGDLITASIYNEIITALEHILTLQVDSANLALANTGKAIGWNIGDIKIAARLGDISNQWLVCNGRTIGNSTSGATARANADMYNLFVYLWEAFANDFLPIQDSSGVLTTRGANAHADFSANKRMPLFDLRGRVVAGLDPTGVAISDSWGRDLGSFGGTDKHTLTVAQMPAHTHNSTDAGFIISASGGSGVAALTTGTGVKNAATTASAGSGAPHNNMQPTVIMNYLIYTGL